MIYIFTFMVGIPLLEENELEDIQVSDTTSPALENRSIADNNSCKLSTALDIP